MLYINNIYVLAHSKVSAISAISAGHKNKLVSAGHYKVISYWAFLFLHPIYSKWTKFWHKNPSFGQIVHTTLYIIK